MLMIVLLASAALGLTGLLRVIAAALQHPTLACADACASYPVTFGFTPALIRNFSSTTLIDRVSALRRHCNSFAKGEFHEHACAGFE